MCGRFVQRQSLAAYLNELDSEEEVISGREETPLARDRVTPSTQVKLRHSTALAAISQFSEDESEPNEGRNHD